MKDRTHHVATYSFKNFNLLMIFCATFLPCIKDDTTKILAPVNASIALGDGGTGITTEINAFYVFSNTISFYGNVYYLVSPRDVSGISTSTWRTPSAFGCIDHGRCVQCAGWIFIKRRFRF